MEHQVPVPLLTNKPFTFFVLVEVVLITLVFVVIVSLVTERFSLLLVIAMIKGNWSLSAELRASERKLQQKAQLRQKHRLLDEKLKNVDPKRLYAQIHRLENDPERQHKQDIKKLESLKRDWQWIVNNGLHAPVVKTILNEEESRKRAKLEAESKLWGKKLVFFNPELNPLGKVPLGYDNVKTDDFSPQIVPADPMVEHLNIQLPAGDPPQFYKNVYNTRK